MPPQAKRIKIRKTIHNYDTLYVLYDSNYGDVMAAETLQIGEAKTVELFTINAFGLPTHYMQKYTKFLLKRILEENSDISLKVYINTCKATSEIMAKELTCIGFTMVIKLNGQVIGTLPKRTLADKKPI